MLERDGKALAIARAERDIAGERFRALHSELGELASIEAEDGQLPLELIEALLRRYASARDTLSRHGIPEPSKDRQARTLADNLDALAPGKEPTND